jgi:hypothetical protein
MASTLKKISEASREVSDLLTTKERRRLPNSTSTWLGITGVWCSVSRVRNAAFAVGVVWDGMSA